jgi:outer membrane biosynthesis protein TonB
VSQGRDKRTSPVALLFQLGGLPAILLSFALHGGAWVALDYLPSVRDVLESIRDVRVELVAEPPEPPEPEVIEPEVIEPEVIEPEPPPEPPPEPVVRERVREPETTPDPTPAEEVPPEEPAPLEERIEDFTGETLSNDSATGPPIVGGNGEAITGPVGAATGTTTGRSRRGTADGAPGGTGTDPEADGVPVMDAADLSRTATPPPDLAELVTRHYPPELRARSVEGQAVVAFVVMPNGILRRLASRSATEDAFAEACIDALRESSGHWGSPLDRTGREVGQRIRFTCRYSLRF